MRDIAGYEGLYAVTSCGKVWSYHSNKFLKPRINKGGYLQVNLSINGKAKNYYIHRLVAEAYIPNPNELPQINHRDECKEHNWLNNLEWCDGKYNSNYGTHNERMGRARSKAVYCVELDKTFYGMREAERQLNISNASISACCLGKVKTAGGYHWQYVE